VFLPFRILFQFVLVKLGIITFDYAHLHSRTDSRAIPAKYCIDDTNRNVFDSDQYVFE